MPIGMVLVLQIKDGSKALLIANLSGFNWRLGIGKVKVKKNKVNRINRNHSKSIEVNQKMKKNVNLRSTSIASTITSIEFD